MKKVFLLLLVGWILIFILVTITWVLRNNVPPAWDQANYLEASLTLYQTLLHQGPIAFLIQTTEIIPRRAPLITIIPVPFYLIFGFHIWVAMLENILFGIIFFLSLFFFTRNQLNQKVALLAVIITSTMPLFYGLATQFFVEFGLTALVISWLYFLTKTNYLENRRYLFLLGLISGLGLMMKITFPLFVTGPFLYYSYLYIKKHSVKNYLIKIIPAGIICLLIIFPWYSKNLITALWHAKRVTTPENLGQYYYGPPFALNTIKLTLLDIINYSISGYYFLLTIILIILSFFLKLQKKLKLNRVIFLYFIIPFLVFFLGPNKDYRLMMPLIPAIGISLAFLLEKVTQSNIRLIILALILPVLIYLNTTFNFSPILNERSTIGPVLITNNSIGYAKKPVNQYWPTREILNFLNQQPPTPKTIVLSSEEEYFNINNLRLFKLEQNLPLSIQTASYYPQNTNPQEILDFISKSDYLIIKTEGDPRPKDLNRFNLSILNLIKWEPVSNNFIFPDGGKLLILKNPNDKP